MWQYGYTNELYHYGVKGMKWGHRRARMQEAKSNYMTAKSRAFNKYEKDIHGIEKGYKRGQMLSKKDQAREAAVEKRYSSDVAKAKSNYKQAKQQIRSEAKTERKEYKQSDEYKAKRAKTLKVGAAVTATALTAYGAYKVNKYMKEKNGQIAAKRGYEYAEQAFKRNLIELQSKPLLPGQTSQKVYLNSGAANKARSYAKTASKDGFMKSTRNVIDYKRSGGSLRSLKPVSQYNDAFNSYTEWERRRR